MHYAGRMEHPPLLNQRLAGASGLASQPVRAAAATPHRRGGSAHRNLRNPRLEVESGVSAGLAALQVLEENLSRAPLLAAGGLPASLSPLGLSKRHPLVAASSRDFSPCARLCRDFPFL